MKLLAEISDREANDGPVAEYDRAYRLRKSARGVIQKTDGQIAVQYLANHHYHKLPGGGVDQGDPVASTLHREILEEVGCAITDIRPLGMVIEYRDQHNLIHISYGYAARLTGDIGPTALEDGEVAEGMETMWLKPAEALEKMKSDSPTTYQGDFILLREQAILTEFLTQQ